MRADGNTWSPPPLWRETWRYARHELLYLAWAGAEAALVGCLAVAFTPWARYWPIYQLGLLLFLLILIPFNLSRVFNLAHVSHGRQQLILIGLLLPVLFLALNQLLYEDTSLLGFRWLSAFYARLTQSGNPFWIRDVTVVIFVSLSWSRGIALIGREVDVDRLGLRLRVGALILAPILIALAGNQQAARVAPFVLLYMLSSLISVALTRAEEIEQGEARHGHSMTVRWFAVVAMASGVITLSAGIFAAATGRNALLFLRNWLGPIWLAIAFAATTTLAAITYVAQPLLALIDFVFAAIISLAQAIRALFPGSLAAQPPPDTSGDLGSNTFDSLVEWLTQPGGARNFGNLRLIFLILIILIILAAAVTLTNTMARRRLSSRDDGELYLEPVLGEEGGGRLRRLWGRLSGRQRQRAAASIRRIYQQMSDVAESFGYPRLEAETPYEYLTSLARVWPQAATETQLITQAYVRVRYGEIPETRAELEQILAAWRTLLNTLPAEEQ